MRLTRLLAGKRTPSYVANFDSSTVFVRATAAVLRGEGFPRLGMLTRPVSKLVRPTNQLPRRMKQRLFAHSGASEAISPDELADVSAEDIRRWVVDQYPQRGYPAVLVGSPNGAAVHLAALLGVPYLPQTFFIPVKRSVQAGAGREDLHWGATHGETLLESEPDFLLHQMHDPNQDRLMIEHVAYFRVKLRRLGTVYEEFLNTVLAPGGTVLLVACEHDWPTTRVGDRHVFQFGGTGDLEPEAYLQGSARVDAFRRRERERGTPIQWNPPKPDTVSPEAEWGFAPELRDDVDRFAAEQGYDVKRLVFDAPDDLSPPVADLYRDTYRRLGYPANRLLVSSFALMDPWWTLRTGSTPYWAVFNTKSDVRSLETYLQGVSEPYDELRAMLFSNGIEAAGIAHVDQWREAISTADTHGFIGVDTETYPADYGSFVRYHEELPETISERQPLVPPQSVAHLETIINGLQRSVTLHPS